MELVNLSCNKCGAPLEVPTGTNFATCSYCKSRLAIHTSGSAAYTQVLENIDNKTTQILESVQAIANQTGANYELCELTFCAGPKIGEPAGKLYFYADATGGRGSYRVALSKALKWELQGLGRGKFEPKQTKEATTELEHIVESLVSDGWEIYSQGPSWCDRKFRRRFK